MSNGSIQGSKPKKARITMTMTCEYEINPNYYPDEVRGSPETMVDFDVKNYDGDSGQLFEMIGLDTTQIVVTGEVITD